MTLPIITTKLHTPSPPATLVSRTRLTDRLDEGAKGKLILVSAPAGFGKTSLLAEWADRSGKKVDIAWVHLDENDNETVRFWSYVIASIQTQHPEFGEVELAGLGSVPPVPIEAILTSLINEIDGVERDLILILDDYHRVEEPAIHESLGYLIEHIPARMCLVIATRTDPPLSIHRLRGRGQMVEIRASDLRFNVEESFSLLSGILKKEFTVEDIEALDKRVEGWAAGLQMAAISMRGREDSQEFIKAFSGSHRYIMDYLTEEIYNQQSTHIQRFLLQTSVLDRLSGPLCNYILGEDAEQPATEGGGSSSQKILETLERTNMFIYPMDEGRNWYRYHRLFADLLQGRLRSTAPEEIGRLQRRASDWFGANGYHDEAFQYALAAEDFQAAARIVESQGYALLRRGSLSTLMGWFNSLPERIIKASAQLNVILAWVLLLTAQTVDVEGYLLAAEERLAGVEETNELRGTIAAIRAYAAARREDVDVALEQSQQALELLPKEEYTVRSVVTFVLGGIYSLKADIRSALEAWKDASHYGERSGNLHLAVVALNSMAAVLVRQGKMAEAEELYVRAQELGTGKRGQPLPVAASNYAGMGKFYLARNDLVKAREHAQLGLELGRQWVNADSQINSLMTLAQVAQLEGHSDEAEQMLAEVDHLVSTRVLMPGTEEYIERVKMRIQAQREDKVLVGSLVEPLTEREIELLKLLAKGRSNPEIAEELVIAVGTVKAHTSSIYRKLDVSNRTEAVVRAKELGLL